MVLVVVALLVISCCCGGGYAKVSEGGWGGVRWDVSGFENWGRDWERFGWMVSVVYFFFFLANFCFLGSGVLLDGGGRRFKGGR